MAKSSVIPNPDPQLQTVLRSTARGRCACCGGPALPVLEQRDGFALCGRCARFCEVRGDTYTHRIPARIDWAAADRAWAVDLGFKKLV